MRRSWELTMAVMIGAGPAWGATETPMRLTPQFVVSRVLEKGLEAEAARLEEKRSALPLARGLGVFDLQVQTAVNFEDSRAESLETFTTDRREALGLNFFLQKRVFTGTDFTLGYEKTSLDWTLSPFLRQNFQLTDARTRDILSLQIAQSLVRNAFGGADRATVAAAEADVETARWAKIENLENVTLEAMQWFWNAYVAREELAQALAARERYEKLVTVVKARSRYDLGNPGELSQALAEAEEQGQAVKLRSADYLRTLDELFRRLQMPPLAESEIEFEVGTLIPELPAVSAVEVAQLRPVRAAQGRKESAELRLRATRVGFLPDVRVTGRAAFVGIDENPDEAATEATALSKPVYFVGLEVRHALDSELIKGEINDRKIQRAEAEVALRRAEDLLRLELVNAERRAQAAYQVAQSAIKTLEHRERAVQEMERAYRNGRVAIVDVIQVYNALFRSQINKIRTVGDYHMSLNRWAALRDELIRDPKKVAERPGG